MSPLANPAYKPNHRILVIDDNPAIHKDFKKILSGGQRAHVALNEAEAVLFGGGPAGSADAPAETQSFEIDSAYQGQEGLLMVKQALAEGRPYAMAFVDVRMPPGWDGIETITRVWRDYPQLQIVICTAFADYSWGQIVQQLGQVDSLVILKKPFDNIEVLQLAHALTKKWLVTQQAACRVEDLDRMVRERTEQLRVTNEKLMSEMAERTQTQEALRQSQKMEAVGQLAAGIAHDFNNILTVIRGHAELRLAAGGLDAGVEESFRQVARAADRAATLTRQLLAFSRRQMMQPKPLDLNHLLHQLTDMLHRVIGEHIRLNCECAEHLPSVFADASNLEQVVMNLAVNARDAMPDGGVLTLRTEAVRINAPDALRNPEARAGLFVRLSVSDSGCGMDTTTLSRAFEPFFTTKPVGKGTGMGLATVHGIVKQHNGWIEVTSRPGQGTKFDIHLPVTNEAPGTVTELLKAAPVKGGNETILVVEDEPSVRSMAVRVLNTAGYRVFDAGSGIEALRVWHEQNRNIDVLFTDMVMPHGMSGRKLAEKVKAGKPELKLIFTSGYSEELKQDGVHADEAVFLPKPYTPPQLLEAVRGCANQLPVAPRTTDAG
jgi:signal transduction histidine kinase